ncbi:DUF4959 domain-containing protein [Chitinophaga lutea]|uniref:DUF4959 domain-containing protein n=1 Tax=Chitinophaga lutea TaxID=2488634 RepID=A0A3N4PTQ1_9BACT|nr:DUF4959 domain-containing protein [Chitinophaga lutea]RPE08391.1 DUF4959 domain-containing protein [Chitinophaga lutea]
MHSNHIFRQPLPLLVVAVCMLFACSKVVDYREPVSNDFTKPGVISNIKVTNFNGGAYITYNLPQSANILYVKADYLIDTKTGKKRQTKSSYYSDTITVEGFAEKSEYEVSLRTVSRSNVESDAVTVKVFPDTPVYRVVSKTIRMQPDFGGVNVQTSNVNKKPVGAILLYKPAGADKYSIYEQKFSDFAFNSFSSRGFDTLPKNFAVYITDQWGNNSDTLFQTIKPLFEEQLSKSKFFENLLPSDGKIGFGWVLSNLWNGRTDGSGWHTVQQNMPMPISCTFGLGVSAKLSRFKLDGRAGYEFAHGNPKVFSIWGSDKAAPADAVLPLSAEEGAQLGDWVNMGNYVWPGPPSGALASAPTATDRDVFKRGMEFNFPFTAPRVRFLRLSVSESWSGATFAHAMEITLFGNTK